MVIFGGGVEILAYFHQFWEFRDIINSGEYLGHIWRLEKVLGQLTAD